MKGGRKNSASDKKGGRKGKKSGAANNSHAHGSAADAVADNNFQSIFSFTQNELENVLQMFETPVGGGTADVERGYGYLQDHQGYGMHPGHHSQGAYAPVAPHPMSSSHSHSHGAYGGHGAGPAHSHNHSHNASPQHPPPSMWHGQHPAAASSHYDQHNPHNQHLPQAPAATTSAPGAAGMNHPRAPAPSMPGSVSGNTNSSAAAAAAARQVKSQPTSANPASAAGGGPVKGEPVVPQRFLPKKGSSSNMKGNSNVSHSVAEKQRRDRINTLIDELRELVPIDLESAEANNQPYGEDPSKRPKHVVLSDTIKFVRNVLMRQQEQVVQVQQQATTRVPDEVLRIKKELADNGTTPSPAESTENNSEKQQCSTGRYRTQSTSSQDSFESNEEIEINVTEMEDKKNYSVNVNGKDRNGLLHDITRALKTLDLEIKTAVIKTNTTGRVDDSFEVDKSYCTLTTKEIETKLRGSLSNEYEMKRKRTLDGGGDNHRRLSSAEET